MPWQPEHDPRAWWYLAGCATVAILVAMAKFG